MCADGVKYWTADTGNTCDSSAGWTPPSCQAAAVNVELNAYALLIYVTKADTATAVLVVKWLSAQRNSNGGFVSTQVCTLQLYGIKVYCSVLCTFLSKPSYCNDRVMSCMLCSHTLCDNERKCLDERSFTPLFGRQIAVSALVVFGVQN